MPERPPIHTGSIDRLRPLAGWGAVASGVIGLIAFGSLFLYLSTQADTFKQTGTIPVAGLVLLRINFAGVMLQALFMIPAAVAVHRLLHRHSPAISRLAVGTGVVALSGVALLRLLLLFNPAISDILFMGPLGFVGVWLVIINRLLSGVLGRGLRIVGIVAGVGLIIVGGSFFFLGGLDVLRDGPYAYQDKVGFHVGIAIGGLPGFILYPVWAILAGRTLLRQRDSEPPQPTPPASRS